MRFLVSAAFRLFALLLSLTQLLVAADIIRIAKTDWIGWETENYTTLQTILFDLEVFRTLRRFECAIHSDTGGPVENPRSLNYLLDTVNEATARFSQAISDIDLLEGVNDAEANARLADLGMKTSLEAKIAGLRLRSYRHRLEGLRDLFSDTEATLDTIPNRVYPTTVLNHNIHALAMYSHDARERSGNWDDAVMDVDTDAPGIFLEFFINLIGEAGKAIELLQGAEEYSDARFGQASTEFIADRDPMAQSYDQMTGEQRVEAAYTLAKVFYQMRQFFQCWLLRTEQIVDLIPMLTQLPAHLEGPYWTQMPEEDSD
ncbi:hypothetical protein TWF696_007175 [Orbilia brochopaga]|uniref:Uncharacterized protein n=1 Tax=Orbilia brochopaga TaxID=3140254 RepID=A0AAV9UR33_9PEZI